MKTKSNHLHSLSFFEFWPAWLFYAPMKIYAVWLSLRFWGPTLPSITNPYFEAGGFAGESKTQIAEQMPQCLNHLFAEQGRFRKTGSEKNDLESAKHIIRERDLRFPLVAKPDVGCRGLGVQRVFNDNDLVQYISEFPMNEDIILQNLYDYPYEVGLFYICHPDWPLGQIFSITEKHFAYVTGDGVSDLKTLIENHPRAGKIQHLYIGKNQGKLTYVVPNGENYKIAFAGSHSQGTIFKNGVHLITPQLIDTWDSISKAIPEFYFGRFDIRYQSPEDLERGQNLKIIEVNGAGAEATHIWDSSTSLIDAYKTLMKQYRHMYEIGHKNRKRGFSPMGIREFRSYIQRHYDLLNLYPKTH